MRDFHASPRRRWLAGLVTAAALGAISITAAVADDASAQDAEAGGVPVAQAPTPEPNDAEHLPEREPAAAPVRFRDHVVFSFRVAHGGESPELRAQRVVQVLERLSNEAAVPPVRYEARADVAIVYGGQLPIAKLYPEDAQAAGDPSLAVHACAVTDQIGEALRSERRRKDIAGNVFSFSLLVFSGLIAVLLLRKATSLFERGRRWVAEHPDRMPEIRVLSLDLVGPAAVRAGVTIALGLGRLLLQVGIVYTWLLFALSLFEPTRGYGARLTGYVLAPISAFVGRIGSSIPMVVVATVAVLAVVMLLRFVRVFFGSVARGETSVSFVPADLAPATGVLVSAAIIVLALLLASPLITGSDDGSLSRAGVAALVALGIATAPVLASVVAGIPAIYRRRLRVGDHVELGGRAGQVRAVNLLETTLVDEQGCELRVPHLATLLQPTRIVGHAPHATVRVVVDPRQPQREVRALLLERARRYGGDARVSLERVDGGGAHWVVTAPVNHKVGEGVDLACDVADALNAAGVKWGGARGEAS